ncbi:MAG TPA: hypothetical protein VFU02_11180 [Polyangiaceae bacterium]|nr:hypothetical protein [Polyangiaceae bacterium]
MTFRLGLCRMSVAVLLGLGTGCASEAPKHWKQLEQCLIGEPLGAEESVFVRLRGIQLAESLEATGGPQDWPARCAKYATDLHTSLSEDGKAGMIKRALAEQLGCQGACAFPQTSHPLPAADKLWEAAARAEFPDVDAPATQKPKAPVKSLTAPEWPPLSGGKLLDEKWSAQGDLWLLIETDSRASWCAVKGAQAKCAEIKGAPQFHGSAPRGFAQDSSQPILVGGVFSETAGLSRVGFALQRGAPAAVFGEHGYEVFDGVGFAQKQPATEERPSPDAPPPAPEFEVVRMAEGTPQSKATLKLSARVRGPEVIDDWFVYVERNDDQKAVFKAKQLAKSGNVFGADSIEHVAEFPGPFHVCRSSPGAAIGAYVEPVRQLGKPASGKAQLSVVLLEGKSWRAPVVHEIPTQVGQFSNWRCGAGWGGVSWLEQQNQELTVTELVCRSGGCKAHKVTWTQPDLKNALALGYIHERAVLVYESSAGDVRTRLATRDELPAAKSRLAFESEEFGGISAGQPLLVERDQTYVVFNEGGLRLLLVDGNGETMPVKH